MTAAVQIAQAEVVKAQLECGERQRHFERLTRIQEECAGAVSLEELDQAEVAWKKAQQDVLIAQARLVGLLDEKESGAGLSSGAAPDGTTV
jgi:multidrug resistance efflux pump